MIAGSLLRAPFLIGVLALGGCGSSDRASAEPGAPPAAASTRGPTGSVADASTWASHVLLSTDAARQALARNDRSAAAAAIDEALGFTGRLGSRSRVPIYEELSQVSVLGPVLAAKGGPTSEAGAPTHDAQSGRAPTAIRAVAGAYSRIVFDAERARARLQAARAELAAGDTARADSDLKAVQASVLLETVARNLPLVRARENVTLARAAWVAGRRSDAVKDLHAVEKALRDFAGLRPAPPQASAATAIADDIAAATASGAVEGSLTAAQLDGWWSRLATLTS